MGSTKRERQRQNRELRLQQEQRQQRRAKARGGLIKGIAAVVALVVLVGGIAFFGTRGGDEEETITDDTSTQPSAPALPTTAGSPAGPALVPFEYGTGECAPEETPAEPVREFDAAPQQCIDLSRAYTAAFVTSEGDITVELDTGSTPGTVNNFVNLARFGYYDDTPIFRIAPSIGIFQGGGETAGASPGYTIPDEGSGFTYQQGDLAMARSEAPNSASAQWFFGATDAISGLDSTGTYVTFGRITEGLDVAERIFSFAPESGETPTKDITLERVVIQERAAGDQPGGSGNTPPPTTPGSSPTTST